MLERLLAPLGVLRVCVRRVGRLFRLKSLIQSFCEEVAAGICIEKTGVEAATRALYDVMVVAVAAGAGAGAGAGAVAAARNVVD